MKLSIENAGFYNSRDFFKNAVVSPVREISRYEIELYTESEGSAVINGIRHEIKKGMLLVGKPGQLRNSILHFKAFYTHVNSFDSTIASYLDEIPDVINILNFEKYEYIFRSMIQVKNSSNANELLLQGMLYELMHMIVTDSRNEMLQNNGYNETNFAVILESAAYIDENSEKEIDLATLSKKANLSPIYFHKLFKKYTGKTPHQYVQEKRIEAAKILLLTTNLTLTEIAFKCGFNSQAYFNYSFKNTTALTPSKFREAKSSQYHL